MHSVGKNGCQFGGKETGKHNWLCCCCLLWWKLFCLFCFSCASISICTRDICAPSRPSGKLARWPTLGLRATVFSARVCPDKTRNLFPIRRQIRHSTLAQKSCYLLTLGQASAPPASVRAALIALALQSPPQGARSFRKEEPKLIWPPTFAQSDGRPCGLGLERRFADRAQLALHKAEVDATGEFCSSFGWPLRVGWRGQSAARGLVCINLQTGRRESAGNLISPPSLRPARLLGASLLFANWLILL